MNKYLEKIAGVPMAVVGGATGLIPGVGMMYGGILGSKTDHPILAGTAGAITGSLPPVGAIYGAMLGYGRGKKKHEKMANIYLEKIAGVMSKGKDLVMAAKKGKVTTMVDRGHAIKVGVGASTVAAGGGFAAGRASKDGAKK